MKSQSLILHAAAAALALTPGMGGAELVIRPHADTGPGLGEWMKRNNRRRIPRSGPRSNGTTSKPSRQQRRRAAEKARRKMRAQQRRRHG